MRQRKAKELDRRLAECSDFMVRPAGEKGEFDYFDNDGDLYLEIGCGKGNFIIKKAKDNPSQNFIAVEGQETVILRALEKVKAEAERGECNFSNLRFMPAFVEHMEDFFEENQLSGIYLNFSDPWPKARHAKRRLTYRRRLEDYRWAIKPGGFIEFKTDNDALYDFTLEELRAADFEISEQSRDLHGSDFPSKETMTEYEERFKNKGKNINYVKVEVK